MEKCPTCRAWFVKCPCCDTYFCPECGSTEEELETDFEEEEE
jgi:hypothetical protein